MSKSPSHSERTKELLAERGAQYGDATAGHQNVGLIWTGLLRGRYGAQALPYPIPPDVVALMMTALKLYRAGLDTPHHEDNFDDAHVYLEIARKASEEK